MVSPYAAKAAQSVLGLLDSANSTITDYLQQSVSLYRQQMATSAKKITDSAGRSAIQTSSSAVSVLAKDNQVKIDQTFAKIDQAIINLITAIPTTVTTNVIANPDAATDTDVEVAAASVAGGRVSDFLVDKWLNELTSNTYAALHYDNPDVAGAYSSEVFGGSYARVKLSMTTSANRAIWNAGTITFTGLPTVSITHLGIWNAAINGDLLYSSPLPTPLRVQTGSRQAFPAGILAFSFD